MAFFWFSNQSQCVKKRKIKKTELNEMIVVKKVNK